MIKFLLSNKFILPVIYIIIGVIIYNVIKIIIKKISKSRFADKKKVTIISLIRNIIKYIIMIFIVLAILNVYGVDTSGVIASLGVAGVIIGLAFQDIVSDLLAGMFILFDNQFALGDIVTIDGFKGEVIGLGLMSTKIKSATGDVKILPNSSFRTVINHSMNDTTLFINVDVSYDTNISKLEKTLKTMEEDILKINGVIGKLVPGAPHETFLVIDATTGQNGISQAKSFKEITNITGIVLSKMDGTAKGGIVLAIKEEVDIPVKFMGLGEGMDDLRPFDIEKYIYGLFKDMM